MQTLRLPRAWPVLAATAALCLLAYGRALSLPLISDDYLQIQLGRDYGPVENWSNLAADALYRCRATSILITWWTERLFGITPLVLNVSSLALHVLNTWLVLGLGYWRLVGWRAAGVAACFFAVYQGHQEAVMWYAALPELLVFLFTVASLLCWIGWLQQERWREGWYVTALLLYVLALLSKESGVVAGPLMIVAAIAERRRLREWWWRTIPFAALAVADFLMIYGARANHLHFQDGTFSLSAPFWIVMPVSIGRLLWIWGLVSLLAIVWWGGRSWTRMLSVAACWIPITLAPYSFLTYMPRVPSRHTYFASVGLALIFAAGALTFQERFRARPRVIAAVAALLLVHQCATLWVRKQRQFLERAAPTEKLAALATTHEGPIYVECFPYHVSVAELVMKMTIGARAHLVLDPREARRLNAKTVNFCEAQTASARATSSARTGGQL